MRIPHFFAAVMVLGACARTPDPAAEPLPDPGQAPAPAPAPAAATAERPLSVCVLQDERVLAVPAVYRSETRDTLVRGRPWQEVYPAGSPPYAAGADWFFNDETMTADSRRAKYGTARIIEPQELQRYGEYRGVPLFVEAGFPGGVADVVYVPVRPGCEFQPYRQVHSIGAVRGR
ncbi:MAG TPA: hypothetical protein VF746_30380 [Longimicrobium sp.]|jgi:hypothetical protein